MCAHRLWVILDVEVIENNAESPDHYAYVVPGVMVVINPFVLET